MCSVSCLWVWVPFKARGIAPGKVRGGGRCDYPEPGAINPISGTVAATSPNTCCFASGILYPGIFQETLFLTHLDRSNSRFCVYQSETKGNFRHFGFSSSPPPPPESLCFLNSAGRGAVRGCFPSLLLLLWAFCEHLAAFGLPAGVLRVDPSGLVYFPRTRF